MSKTQRLTLVATGLGLFMIYLDALIVNVALPVVLTTLHRFLLSSPSSGGEHPKDDAAARESIARELVHALLTLKAVAPSGGEDERSISTSSHSNNPWDLHERASQCLLLLMRSQHKHATTSQKSHPHEDAASASTSSSPA